MELRTLISTKSRLEAVGRKKCLQIESTLSVVYSVQCSGESTGQCKEYSAVESTHKLREPDPDHIYIMNCTELHTALN